MKRLICLLLILNALPLGAMDFDAWNQMHEQIARTPEAIKLANRERFIEELCALAASPEPEEQDATIQRIQNLINDGCTLGHYAQDKYTPLMLAVKRGRKALCRELILAGANPFAKDQNGMTASDHAERMGYTNIVAYLEELQAELLPLSLKQLCINKVRKSVRTQEISADNVRELPEDLLEHFKI